MEQFDRIRAMEARLNAVGAALRALDQALDGYAAAREDLRALNAYYGSEEWFRDREDDAAGKLPAALPRGVLSEDAVWNVLEEDRALLIRLLETAAETLRLP